MIEALPSGVYRVLVLSAAKRPGRRPYTLNFVMPDTGERGRATVLFSDMPQVFGPAELLMGAGGLWLPRTEDGFLPELNLTLQFDAKFGSNRAVDAKRTGRRIECDIRRPEKLSYEDF